MYKKIKFLRLGLCFFLILPCELINANGIDSLEIILNRCYNKAGGLENWRKINSLKTKSKKLFYDSTVGKPFETSETVIYKRPNYYHNIGTYGQWISDGRFVYRKSDIAELFGFGNQIEEVPEIIVKNFAKYDFNFGITDILINSIRKKYLGIRELKSQKCFVIEIYSEHGLSLLLFIDQRSYLIKAYEQIDGKSSYLTFIEEYKVIDGLIFPSSIRTFNNSKLESELEVLEITINPDLPEGFFSIETLKSKK